MTWQTCVSLIPFPREGHQGLVINYKTERISSWSGPVLNLQLQIIMVIVLTSKREHVSLKN